MPFLSDNAATVHPKLWEAMRAADSPDIPYDGDRLSAQLDEWFSDLFGRECAAVWIATGTAANCLALATMVQPHGGVVCHEEAHIEVDEGGAPGFYLHGAKLILASGKSAKLTPADIAVVTDLIRDDVHQVQPHAISITQASEYGCSYRPDELAALGDFARKRGLGIHMDGARFANAVVSLDCSPAQTSWKKGVQMLSFGAGKNGCIGAEALLIFGETGQRERAERLRKRSGHLLSKMRFLSAQLLSYIENDHWLTYAAHANAQAARFAVAVDQHPEARLEYTADANEIFVHWSAEGLTALAESGVQFFLQPGHDDLARFVFSFHTAESETETLCQKLARIRATL
jgi:threonine aldolase